MKLFAYGTLMWPEVLQAVVGRRLYGIPAVLSGFERKRVKGELYPALVASQPGDVVEGILYLDLAEEEFRYLDRFEGEEYDRQTVRIGKAHAQVYVLADAWLHRADTRAWHPEDMQTDRLEAFCLAYKSGYNG